ncbi:MAG: diguanylate cyclase [Treponema sp.]|jgi:diguanylate cyclase (GGDEF)-like protein|nr:diguanylate cyclase [Treponema sp.]
MGEILRSPDLSPLNRAELFSGLPEKDREFVLSRSGFLQLRRGARLFSSGERAERFYMLLHGVIRVFKTGAGRINTELARFNSGDIIGDFDFARMAKYDACAEAVEDSALVMFPGFGLTMDSLGAEDARAVSQIFLGCLNMIVSRIKATRKIIIENMSWIQELHRRAYEDPGTGLWNQSFLTNELSRILENPTALIMLKPDHFKILVDTRGHAVGDDAMIRISRVLQNAARRSGRGWALRFKSNETGLLINNCDPGQAEKIARGLAESLAALEPIPAQGDIPAFSFSGTLSWAVWPEDDPLWDSLYEGNYAFLLDAWRTAGNCVVHYRRTETP